MAHTWGTETVLDLTGTTARTVYDVVLVDRSGRPAPSGSFLGTGATIDCRMNAALAQMQALPTVLAPIVKIRKEELN